MTRRAQWAFLAACAGLAVLALPRPDGGRDRRSAPAQTPTAEPLPPPEASPAPEARRLAPLAICQTITFGQEYGARAELSRGRVPGWTSWVARPPVAPVRAVVSAVGLRPLDLARWVAPVDPWAAWSLTDAERSWEEQDARDLEGEGTELDLGESVRLQADLADVSEAIVASDADPALRELATIDRLVAQREVDWRVGGGDPDTLLAVLLGPSRFETQELALDQVCGRDVVIAPADHERLRRLVASSTDHAFGVKIAAFATRDAWNAGQVDEFRRWAPLLDEQQEACLRWGRLGELADRPELATSFDALPEPYRPEAVRRLAETLAATAGVSGSARVDCGAFPCVVLLPLRPGADHAPLDRIAEATFGPGTWATFGRNDPVTWGVAALPPGWFDADDAWEVLGWRRETAEDERPRWSCLGPEDVAALGAVRAPVSGGR